MKKLLFMMAASTMMLTACNNEPSFKINGTSEGIADGAYVYLMKVEGRNYVKVDSAIVKNNTFTFNGRQDSTITRYVSYRDNTHRYMTDFFLENGNINVKLAETSTATGTVNNDIYNTFKESYMGITKDMMNVYRKSVDKEATEEVRNEMKAKLQKINEDSRKLVIETINANIANPVGVTLFPNYAREFSMEQQIELIAKIPASLRDERINSIAKQIEVLSKTAVGQKFVDFTLKDPEGKDVKLSDFISKNKYTLVDFWASWCGPCRGEMPNVVKTYEKYNKKGFGIVGVSLDNNADKWKAAIKELKMTWNHMSDLKGWSCEGAQIYGVRSIPTTILISQDGTIVARDLRGNQIEETLSKLFK